MVAFSFAVLELLPLQDSRWNQTMILADMGMVMGIHGARGNFLEYVIFFSVIIIIETYKYKHLMNNSLENKMG